MTTTTSWSGRKATEARANLAARTTWPTPCGQCYQPVHPDEPWVCGHILARGTHPHLIWEPSNHRVEHRRCSDATGQAGVIARAKLAGARDAIAGFSGDHTPQQPPPLPVSLPSGRIEPWTVDRRLTWAHHVATAPRWLAPYLVVPENAAPPLAMTEVHPLAVCSYGASTCTHAWRGVPFVVPAPAVAWVEQERRLTLRWWQRLAMVRQLEHDAAGRLVWRTVVESGSRRIGKSERLRSVALWRMEHGVDLFEPGQLVVHVGRDVAVAREVQERAWPWADARGWDVKTGNGKESVSTPAGARWLVKSASAGYGFDVHLGLVDECWDVRPAAIAAGIGPATLERESAQLVLTSSSHADATSLMKTRILAALAADDGRTLLLLWGVTPAADLFAEATWRAASAHWSTDRHEMIAAELQAARDAGPQPDDPDPVRSWANQYLNLWDLGIRSRTVRGDLVVDAEAWADLVEVVPFEVSTSAAIEDWHGLGPTVALAWALDDGTVVVSTTDHDDLAAAAATVRATGYRGTVTVGRSLMGDPALSGVRTVAGEARTGSAANELRRLLAERVVRHDGQAHLTGQVLALRTVDGADGPRMTSSERADAVKAAVWAVGVARRRAAAAGRSSIVLPSP